MNEHICVCVCEYVSMWTHGSVAFSIVTAAAQRLRQFSFNRFSVDENGKKLSIFVLRIIEKPFFGKVIVFL